MIETTRLNVISESMPTNDIRYMGCDRVISISTPELCAKMGSPFVGATSVRRLYHDSNNAVASSFARPKSLTIPSMNIWIRSPISISPSVSSSKARFVRYENITPSCS